MCGTVADWGKSAPDRATVTSQEFGAALGAAAKDAVAAINATNVLQAAVASVLLRRDSELLT